MGMPGRITYQEKKFYIFLKNICLVKKIFIFGASFG